MNLKFHLNAFNQWLIIYVKKMFIELIQMMREKIKKWILVIQSLNLFEIPEDDFAFPCNYILTNKNVIINERVSNWGKYSYY